MWDPAQYLRYAGERARPFFDLVSRVQAADPRLVADLGCGPGNLTVSLAERWPGAVVLGVDNSPEMISAAQAETSGRPGLSFALGDVRDWRPERPVDVLVSNAVLQWVPEHLEVVARWPGMLAAGGWLAFQVPGNFDQPTHAILEDLARSARWAPLLDGVALNRQAADPAEYLDLLASAGCAVDVWETTYLHQLTGEHPVLEWITGTALVPVHERLDEAGWEKFRQELIPLLDDAYPRRSDGTTMFPFRRVFMVAEIGGGSRG
jgi:trans-aconitate 2-methyltransferase